MGCPRLLSTLTSCSPCGSCRSSCLVCTHRSSTGFVQHVSVLVRPVHFHPLFQWRYELLSRSPAHLHPSLALCAGHARKFRLLVTPREQTDSGSRRTWQTRCRWIRTAAQVARTEALEFCTVRTIHRNDPAPRSGIAVAACRNRFLIQCLAFVHAGTPYLNTLKM